VKTARKRGTLAIVRRQDSGQVLLCRRKTAGPPRRCKRPPWCRPARISPQGLSAGGTDTFISLESQSPKTESASACYSADREPDNEPGGIKTAWTSDPARPRARWMLRWRFGLAKRELRSRNGRSMELLSPLFNSASRNRRERARTGGQIKERANPRLRCADGLDPSQQATLACVLSDACVRPAIKPRIQDSDPAAERGTRPPATAGKARRCPTPSGTMECRTVD